MHQDTTGAAENRETYGEYPAAQNAPPHLTTLGAGLTSAALLMN
jgi:hypothetical protein